METGDGSETLYNEEYRECYHSKSGAAEEAVEKYIKPCRIREIAKTGRIRVLDIGFGLGYNAIAAIDAAIESNQNCEIEVISLEKDREIIGKLRDIDAPFTHYHIVSKMEFDPKTDAYYYEDKNVFLKIKIGLAQHTVRTLKEKFDAVFLDPFSPGKNPELWTPEFIADVTRLMKPGAILATYSCARKVRDNLKQAGLSVSDGPIVGRRGPSTVAIKI